MEGRGKELEAKSGEVGVYGTGRVVHCVPDVLNRDTGVQNQQARAIVASRKHKRQDSALSAGREVGRMGAGSQTCCRCFRWGQGRGRQLSLSADRPCNKRIRECWISKEGGPYDKLWWGMSMAWVDGYGAPGHNMYENVVSGSPKRLHGGCGHVVQFVPRAQTLCMPAARKGLCEFRPDGTNCRCRFHARTIPGAALGRPR